MSTKQTHHQFYERQEVTPGEVVLLRQLQVEMKSRIEIAWEPYAANADEKIVPTHATVKSHEPHWGQFVIHELKRFRSAENPFTKLKATGTHPGEKPITPTECAGA